MRRSSAVLGSVVFFLLAPGIVAGVLPLWISGAGVRSPLAGHELLVAPGAILIVMGLAALIASFARFALEGRGTPAPIAPTAALVVTGLYRHVRNPMYVAVLAVILGQALLFASVAVLAYAAAVFVAVHAFVVSYEEPTLRRTYGAGYEAYAAAVPRWIPRLTPWRPGS